MYVHTESSGLTSRVSLETTPSLCKFDVGALLASSVVGLMEERSSCRTGESKTDPHNAEKTRNTEHGVETASGIFTSLSLSFFLRETNCSVLVDPRATGARVSKYKKYSRATGTRGCCRVSIGKRCPQMPVFQEYLAEY